VSDEGGGEAIEWFGFEAELWRWQAATGTAWIFVTLPLEVSEEIREARSMAGPQRGFGSVRVEVSMGNTTWRTSVFPDKDSGCYVLPVKKAVRTTEDLEVDDTVSVKVRLV
jgi:Domain of unknown function (DUF1905)